MVPQTFLISLIVALAVVVPAAGAATDTSPYRRVRQMDLVLDALVHSLADSSPTLRASIDALERSDLIVHVVRRRQPAGIIGSTVFVVAAGGVRYLRIAISPDVVGAAAVSLLGHELHHAVEIAADPSVIDAASLSALYERIGEHCGSTWRKAYDSPAARDAGRDVALELRRGRVAVAAESRRVRHAGFTPPPSPRHHASVE